MKNHTRLRQFIGDFTRLIDRSGNDEPATFEHGGKLLASLVGSDDWLRGRSAEVRATLGA
jgi:3-mercaptopropionate dioxygenase